jgi:SAM-dependent methyltransferase
MVDAMVKSTVRWSGRIRKLLSRYEDRVRSRRPVADAWKGALEGEVNFWRRNLETYKRLSGRLDPHSQLQDEIAQYLDGPDGATLRILDVGAGPLTWLGKQHPRYRLEISAVDTLGREYGEVIDAVGVEPPVRTAACDSERLTDVLPKDHFDLAYARNTLDHSYEPVRAIREMIAVVKPGGVAVLEHAENEAEEERYMGLHQWNFQIENGRLVIWRPGARHDVAAELADVAELEVAEHRSPLDHVVFRKL